MVVRLDVQVPAADRAETRAVGPAEDRVGKTEGDLVARPGTDVELAVGDVLAAELLVAPGVGRLVLLRVDLHLDLRGREAAHARPLEPRGEGQPEDVAARGALNDELGRDLDRRGRVRLSAERERLEREAERLAMLLPRAEAEASQGNPGHASRVASVRPTAPGEESPVTRRSRHNTQLVRRRPSLY